MSKFLTESSQAHYELLKGVTRYLCQTMHWGIKYNHSVDQEDLDPVILVYDAILDESLPPFPVDINSFIGTS